MIWNLVANLYYWANKKKALLTLSHVENTKQLIKKRINLEIYRKINYIRIKYFVNIPVRTDYFSNWFYELTAPVFTLQFK